MYTGGPRPPSMLQGHLRFPFHRTRLPNLKATSGEQWAGQPLSRPPPFRWAITSVWLGSAARGCERSRAGRAGMSMVVRVLATMYSLRSASAKLLHATANNIRLLFDRRAAPARCPAGLPVVDVTPLSRSHKSAGLSNPAILQLLPCILMGSTAVATVCATRTHRPAEACDHQPHRHPVSRQPEAHQGSWSLRPRDDARHGQFPM
ncbi:hypothetical protein DAEQUDRAFT_129327 [Daedalea quercina L-15889]|uniref:Uncharacterized protein n=1 Tax=Daedalea quercina L-15889 TaxID=1314783 RepID=A0A165S155_9APHY|nr:hypothetical protein DAEQUDRAFT_129327 [Daedalea quercina L-15889]